MLQEQTTQTLNAMKLFGMAKGFTERVGDPKHGELSHAELVGLLVQDEKDWRDNSRLKRLLKAAKLRQQACLEDVDYKHPRGLNKQVLLELAGAQWVEGGRNVLLTGPTGVGKSYIACALGNLAARSGFTVLYMRAPRMFEMLSQARGDGTHLKALNRLGRAQVLIIDDLFLTPLGEMERKDLLEIVEDRYASTATVITSQCPVKQWHQGIGDQTLGDAICDRLLHNAFRIELKGDSIRKNGKRKHS